MALNPEVIYPLGCEFCGIASGRSYYATFTNMGNYDQKISINSIQLIDVGALNESRNISPETGLKKVIAELPNGVQMALSFYARTSGSSVYLDVAYGYILNGTYINKNNVGTGNGFTINAAKTFGVRVALIINYPQEAAIEDYTKASSLSFWLFIPNIASDALESWDHIGNGLYSIVYQSGTMRDYDQPTALCYPHGAAFLGTLREAFPLTDINAFVSEVNNLDPGNPISIDDIFKDVEPEPGDNPSEDDPSNPGGGGGSYDPVNPPGTGDGGGGYIRRSEPIPVPGLPTGGSVATGSIKSFLVSPAIITALFRRLWDNNLFDIITWQKIIEEPLDSIVSLICVPVTPTAGGSGSIQLGNIDTQVAAPVITDQYVQVNAGSVLVPEYWGSALDYSPYTKIQIFIPGVGVRDLKPEDVIKQTLSVVYNFDVLTGNFVAHVKCGMSVLYKYPGNMKATIPITSRIYSALEAVMKGAGQAVNSYATGAMTAESRPDATVQSVDAAATRAAAGAAISAAINVAMSKVNIQRSGDISGSTGLLDDFTPYLIIHRPIQSLAKDFRMFKGYPSNISAVLGSLSGYTEVEYAHLENINGATDAELIEIENKLKGGVLI